MSRQILRFQSSAEICAESFLVQIVLARQCFRVCGDVISSDPFHRWEFFWRVWDSETRIRQSFQDCEKLRAFRRTLEPKIQNSLLDTSLNSSPSGKRSSEVSRGKISKPALPTQLRKLSRRSGCPYNIPGDGCISDLHSNILVGKPDNSPRLARFDQRPAQLVVCLALSPSPVRHRIAGTISHELTFLYQLMAFYILIYMRPATERSTLRHTQQSSVVSGGQLSLISQPS